MSASPSPRRGTSPSNFYNNFNQNDYSISPGGVVRDEKVTALQGIRAWQEQFVNGGGW